MKRTAVASSAVASVGYDPGTMTLEVEFTTGSVYRYFEVPEIVHRDLMRAASIGSYVNQSIRDRFHYELL